MDSESEGEGTDVPDEEPSESETEDSWESSVRERW